MRYGDAEIAEPLIGFRLNRWLYALCWTETDRPSVLFDRATISLVTHKVLLPGCSTLERYVARLCSRLAPRLWKSPGSGLSRDQPTRLENRLICSGDFHAYTFCVLSELRTALRRRAVFVAPSWRYTGPHAGLLDHAEWESTRSIICRTLGLSAQPEPTLTVLADALERTYRAVAARLPENPAVRFDKVGDTLELVLSPLDKMAKPASLIALRAEVTGMLPRIDLPEWLLEIAARAAFADAFTHISERTARAADLHVSICAVLMSEACNTGVAPLIRGDVPALKRDRFVPDNASARSTSACAAIFDALSAWRLGPGDAAMAPAHLRDVHRTVAALDQHAARLDRRVACRFFLARTFQVAQRCVWLDGARAVGAEMDLRLGQGTDAECQSGDIKQFFHYFFIKAWNA